MGIAFELEFVEHGPYVASGRTLEDAAGIGVFAGLFGPAFGFDGMHFFANAGGVIFSQAEGSGEDDFGWILLKDAVAVAEASGGVGDGAGTGFRGWWALRARLEPGVPSGARRFGAGQP